MDRRRRRLPYVYALLAMIGIASWIAILYSWSLGVHVENRTWVSRRRMVPVLVVAVVLAAGMLRAETGHVFADWSTIAGMITGAAATVALFMARRLVRAQACSEPPTASVPSCRFWPSTQGRPG